MFRFGLTRTALPARQAASVPSLNGECVSCPVVPTFVCVIGSRRHPACPEHCAAFEDRALCLASNASRVY
jgi:hypothetical protein